jgi:hypothetical protein
MLVEMLNMEEAEEDQQLLPVLHLMQEVLCMEPVVVVVEVFLTLEQLVHFERVAQVELVSHIPPEVEVPVDKRQELTEALERLAVLATCVGRAAVAVEATPGQELEALVVLADYPVAEEVVVVVVQPALEALGELVAMEK